jgi:hypothetical protein
MIVNRNIFTKAERVAIVAREKNQLREPESDNYYNRLLKLIPAEAIAFYLALDGIASNMKNSDTLLWIIFFVSIVGTWLYIVKMTNVKKFFQQLWTVLAFCIWVFVIGGPFQQYEWYDENYGKLLVTAYTFFMPLVYKP